MTDLTCTRRVHFSAGHRVMNHESKCATVHGHNYYVSIQAEASVLDDIGRVVDFSVRKDRVGGWIDEHWDHNFLVWEYDTEVVSALQSLPRKKEPFVCPFNPTAEEMARYLLDDVCPAVLSGTGVQIQSITVFETDNCSATARRAEEGEDFVN